MNMKLMNTWLREVSSVKNGVDELITESVLWFSHTGRMENKVDKKERESVVNGTVRKLRR